MLVIFLPLTALRIPLAAILAPIYGINGIWYAIFSTSMAKGVLIAFWFKLGRWKKRKIDLTKQPPPETLPILESTTRDNC